MNEPSEQTERLQGFDPSAVSGASPGANSPVPTYTLASWWSRVAASLLDTVIIIGLLLPLPITWFVLDAMGYIFSDGLSAGMAIALVLAFVLTTFLYPLLLMKRVGPHNGQTWGKQALGIRVVRDDGLSVTAGFAARREFLIKGLAYGLLANIPIIGLAVVVCYLWPLWEQENRAVHDLLVKSHVAVA